MVSLGACAFVLVGQSLLVDQPLPGPAEGQTRVLQGIIAGVGFIGGGVILQREQKVLNIATAAAIWITAAIGAATGYGRLDVAILLSALTFVTFRLAGPIKQELPDQEEDGEAGQAS